MSLRAFYKVYTFNAGIDFRRQILMSISSQFLKTKYRNTDNPRDLNFTNHVKLCVAVARYNFNWDGN